MNGRDYGIKPGELYLERYRIEEERPARGLYNSEGVEVYTYHALDTYRHEPVTLRAFPLPESPPLASFARALWDREMRTAFLATTTRRGDCLLQIVDSRHLSEENLLVLVTQQGRETLHETLEDEDKPAILEHTERPRLWEEFDRLLKSLYSLHSAGLMHRNLSLDSVYLSAEESGPAFQIGDYSWTVYLHNLSEDLQSPAQRTARDWRHVFYRAPELRGPSNLGESFSTDLYALGVVMAALVSDKVRTVLLSENPPAADIDFKEVLATDSGVSRMERMFFDSILADDPDSRFENALRASDFARQVLKRLSSEQRGSISQKLTVSFDVRPNKKWGKKNLDALERWVDLTGRAMELEEFVQEDTRGQDVYANGTYQKGGTEIPRLFIRGKSGVPYSAEPYWDSKDGDYNYATANLRALKFEPEIPETPLATLEGGVLPTPYPWERAPMTGSWASLFKKVLEDEREESEQSEIDVFRDNLWYILRAEQSMLARNFLPVTVVDQQVGEEGDGDVVRVALRRDARHPEFEDLPPMPLEEWVSGQMRDREMVAYLCADPSLTDFPKETERVGIVGLDEDGLLELDLGPHGPPGDEELWLKPGDVKGHMANYSKKRNALITANKDDYLIQVLSRPEQNTLFLNTRPGGDVWDRILRTRPLYLVQGPPGTGKTFTAKKVISTALKNNIYERILVISQAHKPLDHLKKEVRQELVEQDFDRPPLDVRLAEKAETDWGGVKTHDKNLALLTKQTLQRASRWDPSDEEMDEVAEAWREVVHRELENPGPAWSNLFLRSANIVFTTAMSRAIRKLANHPPFDLVIVEEAAKAYPTELIGALRLGRNWLLIGDQMQLPPYKFNEMADAVGKVLESDDEFQGLDETDQALRRDMVRKQLKFFGSLHERMREADYPFKPARAEKPAEVLTTQRRLPRELSNLISNVFYEEEFALATPHRPPIIEKPTRLSNDRLIWIDCPKASESKSYAEQRQKGGGYRNRGEAQFVLQLINQMKTSSESIAILSPYAAQVGMLKDSLRDAESDLPIDPDQVHTVDSFQGREADLVIISMVRNNLAESPGSALGFLRSAERMNVLLSRPRNQLIIVGNLDMFAAFEGPRMRFLNDIEEFVQDNALILTPRTAGVNL